jgi:transposase
VEVVVERCAGIDVHQAQVTICMRMPGDGRGRREEVAVFATMTPDLLALSDWLADRGVTQVAMEGTGVYWKPVYYVLEDAFELWLVNAQHVKNVPGRKTDTKDAAWVCQLLEHGLLRKSFVPPRATRELRDLTRYRKVLVRERANEVNRLHKVLEDAGVKLATVASDITGVSGRLILAALVAGERDPETLAQLAKTRMRAKLPALRRALDARFRDHHALLVRSLLGHIDYLDGVIGSLSGEIDSALEPHRELVHQLVTIPGVKQRTAEVLLAEIGSDMTRFPTSRHLASWAGLAPGTNESAGKRKHGRTTKGSNWLRTALIEAALAATRHDGQLRAKYLRVRRRRGHQRAVVAVAHTILQIVHTLLATNTTYHDLGADYYDRRDHERQTRRAVRLLEDLGHSVTLAPTS